jgi:hypothetical protein
MHALKYVYFLALPLLGNNDVNDWIYNITIHSFLPKNIMMHTIRLLQLHPQHQYVGITNAFISSEHDSQSV